MIRVVQYGLGPIGQECARAVLSHPNLELVGVIEVDPAKLDRELGDLLELGRSTGVRVGRSEDVLTSGEADVVIQTTLSSLESIRPQLEELIDAGLHVISSSEELFYPWFRSPDLARAIDRRARDAGVAILGTGVNPGFVLDVLPVILTAVCHRVRAVRAERIVDIRTRRIALQRKLGTGLSPEEFRAGVDRGHLGHRGTPESVAFLADSLGWKLDDIREEIEPVIAETDLRGDGLGVRRGEVAGVHQVAVGLEDGRERVRLELQMYAGAAAPRDRITVDGEPSVAVTLEGGVPGDSATVAALLNGAQRLPELRPGLRTMRDVPLPRCTWDSIRSKDDS